jgi:hypothetical protein
MTRLSRRSLVVLLAAASLLVAAGDCNIDIGNLGDFVVTHDVSVTNAGSEDASIWIIAGGTKRQGVIKPGGTLTATLFSGASVLISVHAAEDRLALLKAKRDAILAQLNVQPLTLAGSMEMYQQLNSVAAEIRAYEATGHGQLCAVDLKTDTKGRGNDVTATATELGGDFTLSCE